MSIARASRKMKSSPKTNGATNRAATEATAMAAISIPRTYIQNTESA